MASNQSDFLIVDLIHTYYGRVTFGLVKNMLIIRETKENKKEYISHFSL